MRAPIRMFALCAAVLATGLAQAADIGSIKNLRIGMSMQDVVTLAGEGFQGSEFSCVEDSPRGECTSDAATVAKIPARISMLLVSAAPTPRAPLTSSDRRSMSQEQFESSLADAMKELKVAAIRVVIDSAEHDTLLTALKAKNGIPTFGAVSSYQNAFGMKVSGKQNSWTSGNTSAYLWERCGRIDEACLYIQSAPLMKRYRAFNEPSAKDRQNDL